MARQTSVTVNLTKEMKALVQKRAAQMDRTESNYVLRLIKKDLGLTADEMEAPRASTPSYAVELPQVAAKPAKKKSA